MIMVGESNSHVHLSCSEIILSPSVIDLWLFGPLGVELKNNMHVNVTECDNRHIELELVDISNEENREFDGAYYLDYTCSHPPTNFTENVTVQLPPYRIKHNFLLETDLPDGTTCTARGCYYTEGDSFNRFNVGSNCTVGKLS